MHTKTYVYYFRTDSKQEPIGSVMAHTVAEAREKICIIKQLPIREIEHLFVIKQKKERNANNI